MATVTTTFADFDDSEIYGQGLAKVLDESTRNFVVEFGKDEAKIAFNLAADDVKGLLETGLSEERPVRWINIWAPNHQTSLVDLLGERYGFSARLRAIMKSVPQEHETPLGDKRTNNRYGRKLNRLSGDDVERGTASIDPPRFDPLAPGGDYSSHYSIAKHMKNYQSIDVGGQSLCIGANWMHEIPPSSNNASLTAEGKQVPLWCWLVLCTDNTVITLHEDPGPVNNAQALKSIRGNTHSVLSQLSSHGHLSADPISMQTVRQALKLDAALDIGSEGASNLFYYLFDDWRAVYATISKYRQRLESLESKILNDMTRTSNTGPNIKIIPRLHILGRQIRESDHLYAGYKNLIQRILESKAPARNASTIPLSPPMSPSTAITSNLAAPRKGVVLAQTASLRFERLGDRIQFLILNETQEFLAEKDALISTYFNINAQKDSEATARLTRAATLLAKLSVLFLPVSLMTSYFSVQIPELQRYTSKDYWDAFAVIVSISFMFLFFFSRLLMWITEVLDATTKRIGIKFRSMLTRRAERRDAEPDFDADKLE